MTPELSTPYLGLTLAHPFVAGASPMSDYVDQIKRLEDHGAAAVVMHSLFAEQIEHHREAYSLHFERHQESYAEATTYFPPISEFALGPDQYLAQIQKLKQAVSIPVIASLNGTEEGTWLQYARMIEEAGADALELNLYFLATDPEVSGVDLENRMVELVRAVRSRITIPLAVKLSPFYTSPCHFAVQLDHAGVDGLVLFNRFYQPDVDVENLEAMPVLKLSDSSELLLRLRWTALLYGRVGADLAITGGVHTVVDAVKSIMTGAQVVQVVSSLLRNGPGVFQSLQRDLTEWMEVNEYGHLSEMRGSMSHLKTGNPEAFERTNYMRILKSWKLGV